MFYEFNGRAFYEKEDGQAFDIEDLISERDDAQQERNNLQLENPILRGQVARQRQTIEQLTDENQSLRDALADAEANNTKLRDAAIHAPFAKYEVYEDD